MEGNSRTKSRGAVNIEAAIGMVVFATILFSACEFGLVFLQAATAQYVVAREARDSLTFNTIRTATAGDIVNRIRARAQSLGVNASNWDISICPASTPNCGGANLGSGGDILVVQADPKIRMLGNNFSLNYVASVLISRESAS